MTTSGAAAGLPGASTSKPTGASPAARLVARSCEVAAAAPETFLSLDLPGDAGFWDARALGDVQATAQAGVAWSQPIDPEAAPASLLEAGRLVGGLLVRLGVPTLRALVAMPFDGDDGFVRIPRFAYAVVGSVGRLIVVGDPQAHDVDADLAALRRAWDHAAATTGGGERLRADVLDDGRARYRALVTEALAALDAGLLEKVVTARELSILLERMPSFAALVASLPRVRVARFLVGRGTETFFGATPETLVELGAGVARADALAGSRPAPRGDDPQVAAKLAAELLGSEKDRREHAHVVAFVRRALAGLGAIAPEVEPTLVRLPNVWHLHTPLSAEVQPGITIFDLVAALHPTPAVLGVPPSAARTWLRAHEDFRRGLYAGSIGTVDATGEGRFVVGIRSGRSFVDAETGRPRASLYAGGGIVAGSDVEKELAETDAKLAPLCRLFGCSADGP